MTLENLVTKLGLLADIFLQFDPTTIQHAREITNDRRLNEAEKRELRNTWFWTADSSLYRMEKGNPILYLGDRDDNLIFKNIKEATNQLIKNHNYIPKTEDIETVINSKNALRIKLSDLNLKRYDDEFSYFEIDTVQYNKTLNKTQRTAAERVYGQGNDFDKNMNMLDDANISTTRFYVLNPHYVKDQVKEGKALARACWLGSFGNDSYFLADGGGVDYPGLPSGALRGVPKVAEGDVAQKITFGEKIRKLLETILPE